MRICVYGAGAVGGHMAVRFANAGETVSLVARGAQLEALRRDGLTLHSGAQTWTHRLPVAADAAEFGEQDVVVVAVKANGLDAMAEGIAPLLGPRTRVVFAINGLPWWYLDELRGADVRDSPIRRVVAGSRVIHCVVNSSNIVEMPGVVHNDLPSPNRFTFGAALDDGTQSCRMLAESMTRGGAVGAVSGDIRTDIWRKLQTNTMLHPVACLTGADGRTIVMAPDLRMIVLRLAEETKVVAAAWGIEIGFNPERLNPTNFAAHKSSALQDLELGRPIEIDEVGGAVQEAGVRKSVATPVLDQCLALLRMRARLLGLYHK